MVTFCCRRTGKINKLKKCPLLSTFSGFHFYNNNLMGGQLIINSPPIIYIFILKQRVKGWRVRVDSLYLPSEMQKEQVESLRNGWRVVDT